MTSLAIYSIFLHPLNVKIIRLFKFIASSSLEFQGPGPNARVVYIDGAFDLFHAGHVEVHPGASAFTFVTLIMNVAI